MSYWQGHSLTKMKNLFVIPFTLVKRTWITVKTPIFLMQQGSNKFLYLNTSKPVHSQKKRKDSLETRTVLLIFSLELEISGVAVQSIHQNSKKWWRLWGIAKWKWLWDCFSHFLLLWPWCQGFWVIAEDRYRSKRVSQMLLVFYSMLNSQNIPINQKVTVKNGWLQGYLRRS